MAEENLQHRAEFCSLCPPSGRACCCCNRKYSNLRQKGKSKPPVAINKHGAWGMSTWMHPQTEADSDTTNIWVTKHKSLIHPLSAMGRGQFPGVFTNKTVKLFWELLLYLQNLHNFSLHILVSSRTFLLFLALQYYPPPPPNIILDTALCHLALHCILQSQISLHVHAWHPVKYTVHVYQRTEHWETKIRRKKKDFLPSTWKKADQNNVKNW